MVGFKVISGFRLVKKKICIIELRHEKTIYVAVHHEKTQISQGGPQWLSGRVLDSRPRGRGFEPHRRHCVVVLEQDTFILA